MSDILQRDVTTAAALMRAAQKIVVFTGAGISTESGIPDFRSPGGIWSTYNQDDLTYQRFRSHEKYRKIYWEYDRARYPAMRDAAPNPAHRAVLEIEKSGRLLALITQNIDGLHHKAGSSPEKIYELHGTVREVTCLDCYRRWPREKITEEMDREGIDVPYCQHCGGPLKCATIAFGQSLPPEVLESSFDHARNCDLFLTVGSSLVVQPAAMLPVEAKRKRARLILVNLSSTPYDDIMDVILIGKAAPTMEALMDEFRRG
ncbi:MAG: Sir2 family NAD-dependent protein deacetylase [Desulfomonile tiedjei]|uniref:protein acetyllysine N-acetyltransferase n=1 Tax=Desulfomonile tiedjei TaxID=2358 RepID=A0A9D6Z685_9BACT|nr:Sir2 family NAD-dependent protein deacetylase [Desulfomonile tiedjei]